MLKIGLVLLVALTGGLGYVMGPPQRHFEMPEPQAEKTKFDFDDIWGFRPQRFSARWFGDKMVFQNKSGHVVSHDNGTETVLMTSEERTNLGVVQFYPSADLSELILLTQWKQVWRHSSTAVYLIFNVNTKNVTHVAGQGARIQYCRWAPVGGSLVYVHGNNIYYMSNSAAAAVQITTDGHMKNLFNGIPDWMYEEDVISVAYAHYWSPDAKFIVFGKFNDTLVPKQKFKMYGDKSDVYGQIEEIAYPKAGDVTEDDKPGPITAATLHLVDVADTSVIHHIAPPASMKDRDHYYTRVAWLNSNHVLITWTNRVQNESVVQACDVSTITCYDHFEYSVSNGWIDSPWPYPVTVTSDGTKYVIPHSKPEGASGTWKHVALMEVKNNTLAVPVFLTSGEHEVISILAHDHEENHVYYLGTGGDPTKRHLYRVSVANASAGSECVSCAMGDDCQYVSASFSSSTSSYVMSCLGPEVPTYSVRSTRDGSFTVVEDNQAFKDEIAKKLMPTREFMEFTVEGGFKTQAEIFKPPNFDAKKKYPLLVFVYGGPGSQRVMQSYPLGSSQRNWLNFLRSSHEVVVASVDGRGSASRGDNFRYQMYRKLGTVEVTDQIDFTRHIKEKLGYIDNSKDAAIFGWSYGGQTTSHVLAEAGDVIKCAIAVAPVTTKTFYDSAYTERYMGLATKSDNEAGYNQTDVLHKVAKYADRKYLIAHGTADDNVHFMNAAHMINELVKHEIQFKQLMYVDENHSIGTRSHSRHLFRSLTNFLVDDCWDLNAPVVTPSPTPTSGAASHGLSLLLTVSFLSALLTLRNL